MCSLAGKRITVAGGSGFLGRFLIPRLRAEGANEIFVPRKRDYDLRNREDVASLFADTNPQLLIHLAGTVGGIGANRQNPGAFFYDNMAMGLHIIEVARQYGGLEKLVIVGTTCSYPKLAQTPFREEDLWNGYPEETNAPYGIAKKALLVMLQGYREQYGLNGIYLIPANLYGPGDNFDLETSHVIPALIRKFVEVKETGSTSVEVWGTGNVSREFLYVEDAAEGIVLATLRYDKKEPVNLGTGSEIFIRDLVEEIRTLVGYRGEVVWKRSQPDGQPRRRLDVSRAEQEFGFRAKTHLCIGLKKALAWYQKARRKTAAEARAGQIAT
ncbi:MAG TPA: GDP-L-fucose synthase [Candidatus Acidoferrales bacterium]|nr:GDP-L-fucose synthase [Candidatus Acidoferrales bacterium]